jgi:hypothetical protein
LACGIGGHGAPIKKHRKAHLGTDKSRQALGATGSGDKPQFQLCHAKTRRWRCNPAMAGKGKLEPRAKRPPLEGRKDRNGCLLDPRGHIGHRRCATLSGGVGNRQTDAEIRPLPCNHNAEECPIGKQAIETLHQGAAHIVIKAIAGVASITRWPTPL